MYMSPTLVEKGNKVILSNISKPSKLDRIFYLFHIIPSTIRIWVKITKSTLRHTPNFIKTSRFECVFENKFSYFLTKTYVVGTQKNRLNETVLLSTQNTCLNWRVRKYSQIYSQNISLSGAMVLIRLNMITGFIQASMSKNKGLFKDFLKLSNSFQGITVDEKYWSKC